MSAIIIGDGLTREVLSPELPYRDSKRNVGQAESARLLGRGRSFGEGPLPLFLRRAVETGSRGEGGGVILLATPPDSTAGEETSTESTGPGVFVDPLQDLSRQARVVPASRGSIPWQELMSTIEAIIGSDASAERSKQAEPRFLVIGCHTEHQITAIATFLSNVLGYPRVAVASHLVGSSTPAGHFAALRHNLPSAGVEVILDLEEAARYAGLDPRPFQGLDYGPCSLELPSEEESLEAEQRRIVELLCLHWTRARLRPLAGGFSGSLLLLADGWKGEARTEPLVLKIDAFAQMRRELDGYHLVKDFFGKHVPTFSYPVAGGDLIGVGMELAAMEGRPRTLQDAFEETEDEESLGRFLRQLDKALELLSAKLYSNTREKSGVVPYRIFGLHAQKQQQWLRQNSELILSYLETELEGETKPDPEQLEKLLKLIAANGDSLDSEVCLSHGDLNYANVICDEADNIWFIDWTHSGFAPVELDFAKLESDVKFVMSKDFDADDLPRLKKLEEYLVSHRLPAEANSLPETLKFAKWDLRFRKILGTVRRIRETCFALKETDDWLVYRIALLRYALHTLSFDKRRGRGECDPVQLMFALYSADSLIFDLVADDFHLKIRGERPAVYPPRLRISIDESPWMLDCPGYDPPYYVDSSVTENEGGDGTDGWADPEDFAKVKDEPRIVAAKFKDDAGMPLNPRGRTGIAGRGLLGLWGPNLSVAVTLMRTNEATGQLEILLGNEEEGQNLELPKGFVLPGEEPEAAVLRVLESETGWRPSELQSEIVFEGYTYDPRQTDHAWVESRVSLIVVGGDLGRSTFQPGGEFDEVKWWPLEAETINRVPSGQARFVRDSITRLVEAGDLDKAAAEDLLAATG